MSSSPLVIEADVVDGDRRRRVSRQVAVATAGGHLENVALQPDSAQAHPVAVRAIEEADWVVLGPGSWYSSVLPHLVLPSMRDSLLSTSGRRALVLNLSTQRGETDGMTPADHVSVLTDYAPGLHLDIVVADPSTVQDVGALETACQASVCCTPSKCALDSAPRCAMSFGAPAIISCMDGFLLSRMRRGLA